jgi:NAD(P)-dependent dehydrogenase (short-subunit alcohol dehydrogenase family)
MTAFLKDKVVVVTGGSSGIGQQVVAKLLAAEAIVHVLDRQPLAEGHSPYPATGKLYTYTDVELGSRQKVHATFQEIFKISPNVYGIVCVAGANPQDPGRPLIEKDETYDSIFATNTAGTYYPVTELLQHIIDTKQPAKDGEEVRETKHSIVTVGSTASAIGFTKCCAYTGAKHAVLGFTRVWARDFGQYGVRCNMVAPGSTDTPLGRKAMVEQSDIMEATRLSCPFRRFGQPSELADTMIYLLGDQSSWITGQILHCNGGIF